ncbi:MAG TPA: hypothetical protein VFS67_11730 [Polyangiaceae bacterium]|nr:hypothetical protein [Polyangiaceae bacterium]
MTLRSRFTCLGCHSFALLLLAACAADSGQTGSPVSQDPPPPYQSPAREEPQRPGGGTDNGGVGSGQPDAVPRPVPKPGSTALLGDTLVVAEHGELVLVDVSVPGQPRVLAHTELGSTAGAARLEAVGSSLVRADSLAELVLSVGLSEHASVSTVPPALVPRQVQQLVTVDASDPSAPRVLSRSAVPAGALELTVHGAVFSALGAEGAQTGSSGSGCVLNGANNDLALWLPPPATTSLWLQRFDAAAPAAARRSFAAGHWIVASDQSHALRVGLQAHETPLASFEIELVDLSSLETVFQTRLDPADLGTPVASEIGADYSDGVLVLAGGSRLLAFEVASGVALPPVTTPGPITNLRFLDPSQIALEGTGAALAELDRSGASPALRLVPLAAGTPITAPLMPFGNGYIALDGTGGPAQLLRATSYARDEQGALKLVDQLQTNWAFSTNFYYGTPWRIDAGGERLSYTQPDNESGGLTGVIQGNAGQLSASERLQTALMSPAPLFHGDALLAFGSGVLQPLQLGAPLTALPAHRLVLEDVWFEVRHAGLIWALHRTDTGRSSLSVRAGEHDEPITVELPHAVDAIQPIDATHVAVLGFSVPGMCDSWRESSPDLALECGLNAGNGVSIVAADGASARVVRSIALNSFLEGRPPTGIDQSIDWYGFLPLESGNWALWGNQRQTCYSEASCQALGVPAYKSYGTSGCSSGQTCSSETLAFTTGYLDESWLFPLDVSDPEAPVLGSAVRPGPRLSAVAEVGIDLAPQLLGYETSGGRIWGYVVDEPLFGTNGEYVTDVHGQSLHRWYVQLVDDLGAAPSFSTKVSLPGQAVLLARGTIAGGNAQHTAFTLEPRYAEGGEQTLQLHRSRVIDGLARIDQSLDLGPNAIDARASGERIAVLSGPADYCSADATYSLQVVDASQPELQISSALELPRSGGFGWGFDLAQTSSGEIQLRGGPSPGGTLFVDLTSDPPRVSRYQY